MGKYRKKPVVIEAWPVRELFQTLTRGKWIDLPEPVKEAYEANLLIFADSPKRIEVKTLEGWMTGDLDSMLIQGVKAELYTCQGDIFEATYEAVEA